MTPMRPVSLRAHIATPRPKIAFRNREALSADDVAALIVIGMLYAVAWWVL